MVFVTKPFIEFKLFSIVQEIMALLVFFLARFFSITCKEINVLDQRIQTKTNSKTIPKKCNFFGKSFLLDLSHKCIKRQIINKYKNLLY